MNTFRTTSKDVFATFFLQKVFLLSLKHDTYLKSALISWHNEMTKFVHYKSMDRKICYGVTRKWSSFETKAHLTFFWICLLL